MAENEMMKEVELELSVAELELFASYCLRHEIKFNDWIRVLAHEAIAREGLQRDT